MALDEAAQAEAQALVWSYARFWVCRTLSHENRRRTVDCPSASLYRIMRFLIHHGIFEKTSDAAGSNSPPLVFYAQTPLSRLFTRDKMGPFMLLQGRPRGMMDGVTVEALRTRKRPDLKTVDGEDSWTDKDLSHSKRFTVAMISHARVTASAIVGNYSEAFESVGTVVDVGGHHGMALSMLVKAFPWVRGVCFDLPDIVAKATPLDGVDLVGGNMFDSVPKADALMLMWVLHNWSDKACVEILKKCKEAVPMDTGKVMIVEAIIDEDGEGDEYTEARLLLDMQMLAVTVGGKERTYKEWVHLLKEAGFSRHTVKNIGTIESVIEAYP